MFEIWGETETRSERLRQSL